MDNTNFSGNEVVKKDEIDKLIKVSEDIDIEFIDAVEVLKKSQYFDAEFYKNQYKDVQGNLYSHYLSYGWKEGRIPSLEFDPKKYCCQNGISNDINPVLHYEIIGKSDDKYKIYETDYMIVKKSKYFDIDYYNKRNQDVEKNGIDPIKHYISVGWKEGRATYPGIDWKHYAFDNSLGDDVNPLIHYEMNKDHVTITVTPANEIEYLKNLVRNSNLDLFNDDWYSKEYKILDTDPLEHYILEGWKKGYNPSPFFDTEFYLSKYDDVKYANVNPLLHYINNGYYEGREVMDKSKTIRLLSFVDKLNPNDTNINIIDNILVNKRINYEYFLKKISDYDIISFDIYDTAVIRCVNSPSIIFEIIGKIYNIPDFSHMRGKAERLARELKNKRCGTREITIYDIYEKINEVFAIDKGIQKKEIELEIASTLANSYIHKIYEELLRKGKKVIFCSDMYLPRNIICQILNKCDYKEYELYLSNELGKSKEDKGIQKFLLELYPQKKIVHIGDNIISDYKNFKECGIDSVFYRPDSLAKKFYFLNNIEGNIIGSVFKHELNSVCYNEYFKTRFFTHGFMFGGPIVQGYCNFINNIGVFDKILFCARDCRIIHKVYNQFYKNTDNDYIKVSRVALMKLMPERYAYEILTRFIFRYWNDNKNILTIEQLLVDTGFDYLINYLEDYDIEKYLFCCSASQSDFEKFFIGTIPVQVQRIEYTRKLAIRRLAKVIGRSKTILVADVGWSGSCFNIIADFIHAYINPSAIIKGALIFASDSAKVLNQICNGDLYCFISGPHMNEDLSRIIHPKDTDMREKVHMAVEYLFTDVDSSLYEYGSDRDELLFITKNAECPNPQEIIDMHDGMIHFNRVYNEYVKRLCLNDYKPSPYVSLSTMREFFLNDTYLNCIYSHFYYDGNSLINFDNKTSLFKNCQGIFKMKIPNSAAKQSIIFVTNELSYTGGSRSLLRVTRIAKNLGYQPIIWSIVDGIFRTEFENEGFEVFCVNVTQLDRYKQMISDSKLVYCNTIVTYRFVEEIQDSKPTVWFIREASNIPNYISNTPDILRVLKISKNIFTVSRYAASYIKQYTNNKVHVLRNCVEDESCYSSGYIPGSGSVVKFIQLGTIEKRKGYDVLIDAIISLPDNYKRRCELYFAGAPINSQTNFMRKIINDSESQNNIHYLGLISNIEQKIRTISDMDVVVVASRDESCSLVALEGCMLSKPIIVTENVGAKYMVEQMKNGVIVETGSVESLQNAIKFMIDSKSHLHEMGKLSRVLYDKYANIASHTDNLEKLFNLDFNYDQTPLVVVSMTSYPERMKTIKPCLESLLGQSYSNFVIELYLSKDEFPCGLGDIDSSLRDLIINSGRIHLEFVDNDLKSHKKYFYSMQKHRDLPIITVDDDVIYNEHMVQKLVNSYLLYPDSISCHRCHQMTFKPNGELREYSKWRYEFKMSKGIPSFSLLPTGNAGVLYPPNCLPDLIFNVEYIERVITADDIWLKFMSLTNDIKVVLVSDFCECVDVSNSQENALYKKNIFQNFNDIAIREIKCIFSENSISYKEILNKIYMNDL